MFCKLWQLIHPLYHQYTDSAKLCNKSAISRKFCCTEDLSILKKYCLKHLN
ncbi:hypothetical protein BpHYR1_043565 [Brachionus plicatilis]|uniref:Uncharacterized protein n=1 Tax=Brachionus plicatilis TaxID=10195 RepID=A0A3M7PX36_BRAPC|nr:hypothetical protein BpHYR1_043565 [Brachionus plicatilis]